MKKYFFVFCLLIVLVLIFGCRDKEAQEQAKIQQELISDTTVPVTLIEPTVKTIEDVIEITGQLEAQTEIQLGAKVPGKITSVSVKDGSQVRAGQVIATVDSTELYYAVQQAEAAVASARSAKAQAELQAKISPEQTQANIKQAEAQLESAKARLQLLLKGAREQEKKQAQERVAEAKAGMDKAKNDLDRMKQLYAQDAVSKADVDAAQMQYDSSVARYRQALEAYNQILEGARPEEIRQAEQDVKQAEEAVKSAKTATTMDAVRNEQVRQAEAQLRQAESQLRTARTRLADASIVSPVDGFVIGKPAQIGQVVGAGTPVATIVSVAGTYVEGQLPEREVANVQVGMPVRIRVDAFPNEEFKGTVLAIRPSATALGRLFAARIAIDDPTNRLKPGMFARAKVLKSKIDDAVLLPVGAILENGEEKFVFIPDGDKAKKMPIETGLLEGEYVQVLNFSSTQKVILKGKDQLADGSKIKVETNNNKSNGKA